MKFIHQFHKRTIAMVAVIFFLVGCQVAPLRSSANDATLAVFWVQNSAEYQALAYQAYNLAKECFDAAPANRPRIVVMDLDETVLDNSAYAAWTIRNGLSYSDESWNAWVADASAKAVPGSIDFINHVQQRGGQVYFVSNRIKTGMQATLENLRQLGVHEINPQFLLLKQAESSKEKRFDQIRTQVGEPLLFIGDSITDFDDEATTLKGRAVSQAFVSHQSKIFGQKYIILPNPVYGSWLPRQKELLSTGMQTWK